MKTTTIRTACAVAALVLGMTACGDDDETEGDAPAAAEADGADDTAAPTTAEATEATDAPAGDGSLVSALADNMMEEAAVGGSPVATREEAECWANRIVDGVGEDRLNELGVTPQSVGELDELDLTDAEISTVVDSLFDCADVQQAFADQFSTDFGAEAATCIADALDEDLVKEALRASIAGDASEPSAEFIETFTQIAADCGIQG
jgi:hypothetical protein